MKNFDRSHPKSEKLWLLESWELWTKSCGCANASASKWTKFGSFKSSSFPFSPFFSSQVKFRIHQHLFINLTKFNQIRPKFWCYLFLYKLYSVCIARFLSDLSFKGTVNRIIQQSRLNLLTFVNDRSYRQLWSQLMILESDYHHFSRKKWINNDVMIPLSWVSSLHKFLIPSHLRQIPDTKENEAFG